MLERAKSSILQNGNFFFGGGNFAFSKREFPVALIADLRTKVEWIVF